MLLRDLPWSDAPPAEKRGRELAVSLLRALSASLDRLAVRLSWVDALTPLADPMIEFHAEAGAPEGALYVNGQLVGHVVGVSRL